MDRRAMHKLDVMLDTQGRQLSVADREFVHILLRELEQFQSQAPKDRALMFHPLTGFQRYLIHKVTELYPKLSSFTITDEKQKRTVVCFKSKRKEQQMHMAREQRPPSSTMPLPVESRARKSKGSTGRRDSPARSRLHESEPESRPKPRRYNTISNDAVRKRERGLNLEGHVVNGDYPRSDIEDTRRKHRPDSRKKHRTKRSLSQPHLNERRGSRHRRDSVGESSDHRNSDLELNQKPRHAASASNIPDKKRSKSKSRMKEPPIERTEPVVSRRSIDEIRPSSGTEFSRQDDHSSSDNDENEIPPSYETTSSEAKNKAMRNLMRIKRTNSTRSCPPLDKPKRHYVNGDVALLKKENADPSFQGSPVFDRKIDGSQTRLNRNDSRTETKPKDRSRKKKKSKNKENREASREYVNIPKEVERQDSYESSPFDSSWLGDPEPTRNGAKEIAAVIEKVPSFTSITDSQLDVVDSGTRPLPGNLEEAQPVQPVSFEVPVDLLKNIKGSSVNSVDKDTQTDLHGSVIDIMTSTYNMSLNSLGPNLLNGPINSKMTPTVSASGASTPTLSNPSSAYEKLGEYMFKAMLNFQSMLVEGQPLPQAHDIRTPIASEAFRTAPVYPPMPHPTQPVLVPWMSPYYPDPMAPRPPGFYHSQPSENCCPHHQSSTSSAGKGGSRSKQSSFTSTSSRDDEALRHRSRSHKSRKNSGKLPSHVVPGHPLRLSKGPDTHDSDASSEITNPEIAVTEGGDGLMVYVRNSNRSTSSATGSVVELESSSNFPVASGDARASPLGHDRDDVFNGSKKKDKGNKSKAPKKESAKVDRPVAVAESKLLAAGQMEPLKASAPLAKMDDEWMSDSSSASSTTSRRSSLHDRESDSTDAEMARSLVGEDLGPLVSFDDNLEMACEDGTTED